MIKRNAKRWAEYHANPEKWFWARVNSSAGDDACWPWAGRKLSGKRAYGRLVFKGKWIGAHRFALILTSGEPDCGGLFACHSCDNPPCCNPRHLFWGTHQDNMDDCAAKGRKRGHPKKIDIAAVLQMRGTGMTKAQIARVIGVHPTNIKRSLDSYAKTRSMTDTMQDGATP